MMISDTIRYNVESVKTLYVFPNVHFKQISQ